VAGSKMSVKTGKTSKTTSGALDKHCPRCEKRFSGSNWSKHNKWHREKGDGKVEPNKCTGTDC